MSNMRDAFKKAKLISDKDARRLAHEERVHRTDVGREGVEHEQRAHRQDIEQLRDADRERTRQTQEELEKARRVEAEQAACLALLENEARRPAPGGRMRFFFQLRDGRLPWIEVNEQDGRLLQASAVCIVALSEGRAHDYGLLATEHARRVAAILPERVVHAPRGIVRRS